MPDDAAEDDWPAFAEGVHRPMLDTTDRAEGGDPMPYDGLRAVMKEPWQVMVGFTALAVRDEAKRSLNTWMTGGRLRAPRLGLATALKT